MRLRLFERLSRLATWRFGSRAEGDGRTRDSRPRDDAGRHRRSAGDTQSRFFRGGPSRMPDGPLQRTGEQPQPPAGFQQPPGFPQPSAAFPEPPGFQQQAGYQQRVGYPAEPADTRADAWAGGMSGPSAPGKYGPGSGDVNEAWPGGPAGHGPAAGGWPCGCGAANGSAARRAPRAACVAFAMPAWPA